MRFQRVVILFTVTFAATLALVAGQRLSSEMMAVIVGVAAGVAASIPTSLLIVWVARHALASPARNTPAPEYKPEPPDQGTRIVIVPTPAAGFPAGNAYLPLNTPLAPYAQVAQPRHFTIIGGEAAQEDDPLPGR
jgi:hypothetical protein